MATPRVAAGALFFDEDGRVLLVKPAYKERWDIPGGYAEPGESPQAACVREVKEELGISPPIGDLLVVDWAPTEAEGDKMLFIFNGGIIGQNERNRIEFTDGELVEWRLVSDSELPEHLPERLLRRVRTAVNARQRGVPAYAEHGVETATTKGPY
jgi:8-oxo-dGTP diphosphatase